MVSSPTRIMSIAESKFNMDYTSTVKVKNKDVMLFSINDSSDINGFINYFKAEKMTDSHNEDILYGVVI